MMNKQKVHDKKTGSFHTIYVTRELDEITEQTRIERGWNRSYMYSKAIAKLLVELGKLLPTEAGQN